MLCRPRRGATPSPPHCTCLIAPARPLVGSADQGGRTREGACKNQVATRPERAAALNAQLREPR
eukprot:scaffold116350_cov28-Tisochrysis_lutea.AAC.2